MIMMVCIPIIICAFLLLFKRQETSASRFLATFLFLCVFALCPQTIGFSGFYEVWPELTFFPFSVELWLGPLFYLHAFLLIKGGSLGKRKWFLLLGVLKTSYYCWAFLGYMRYDAVPIQEVAAIIGLKS